MTEIEELLRTDLHRLAAEAAPARGRETATEAIDRARTQRRARVGVAVVAVAAAAVVAVVPIGERFLTAPTATSTDQSAAAPARSEVPDSRVEQQAAEQAAAQAAAEAERMSRASAIAELVAARAGADAGLATSSVNDLDHGDTPPIAFYGEAMGQCLAPSGFDVAVISSGTALRVPLRPEQHALFVQTFSECLLQTRYG